jgi:tetratricopeptide (TPR) repeat protein
MGFDLSQVTSDSNHYSNFVCRICNNLGNLNSGVVVTASCNHVFCKSCIQEYAEKNLHDNKSKSNNSSFVSCQCPVCQQDLTTTTHTPNDKHKILQVNDTSWISVGLIEEVQPLAYQCLQMVQVKCKLPSLSTNQSLFSSLSSSSNEYWIGNYGDLPSHLLAENNCTSTTATQTKSTLASTLTAAAAQSLSIITKAAIPLAPTTRTSLLRDDDDDEDEEEEDLKPTLYDGVEVGEPSNVGVTTRGTGAHHKRMVDSAVVANHRSSLPPKSPAAGAIAGTTGSSSGLGDGDRDGRSSPRSPSLVIDIMPADYDYDPADLQRAMERCDKLKKQANAKFNRADVDGARVLYSEGLALLSDFPLDPIKDDENNDDDNNEEQQNKNKIQNDIIQEIRIMVASLYSNRAVTFYRERILSPSVEDCNKSLELDPKSEKTYIRKWRALDAMGEIDMAITCLEDGVKELPNSNKLQDQLRKSLAPQSSSNMMMMAGGSGSGSGSHLRGSDRSIVSMFGGGGDKETVASGKFGKHEMDISVAGDPNHTVLDRAERLKKQANAKFNKGDIEAARSLYSDALGCIPQAGLFSRGVKELLSELHSNRAVTYYRNKQYQESLDDCDHAITQNPEAEKSYIRKARALVGLERHTDASKCLQDAYKRFPISKKIKEELSKMIDQRDAFGLGKGGSIGTGGGSNDSVDFNASVGSLSNFYPPSQSKSMAAQTLSTGREELTHADDIDLSDRLKRNANAKFNRGDIAGARSLYTEALNCLPNDRENENIRVCLASLYANRAVTYYREQEFGQSMRDCDMAIELDPKGEKPYSRKARSLASLERYDEAIKCLEEGKRQVPGSNKLEEELVKIKQEQQEGAAAAAAADASAPPPSEAQTDNKNDDDDPHASAAAPTDNNDANFFVPPGGAAMASVPEGKSREFDLPTQINAEEFDRAEKLKKQANAKLNKGDVAGARVLYGEGLACMPPGCEETPEGRELAANLYANRAVTFFREKKFRETVNDCNKAVEYDPKHEKSYIRKWRALMALGTFEDAYRCLESAVKELPDSERLNEELANASEEKDLLRTVNQLIASREYQEAHDTLKTIVKTSDNIALWLAAARVDSCLGHTESALDRVEKVLVFNSKHAEALRVQGYATFLSGEMDHGINILKESLEGDIDETVNRKASDILQGCQQKLNAFHKGQARVKRGRYKEAVDLFTIVMKEGETIPHQAPLYGNILTERAEANLLSDQYEAALADCAEAISLKQDNLTAWTVKIEVYYALDRLQEARDELAVARKTWGARNETIEDAYKKTDFELRLQKVDNELRYLVATVECGKSPGDGSGVLHMNHSQRRNRSVDDNNSSSNDKGMRSASPRSSTDNNGTNTNKRSQSRSKREGFKFGSVIKPSSFRRKDNKQGSRASRERGGGRPNNSTAI